VKDHGKGSKEWKIDQRPSDAVAPERIAVTMKYHVIATSGRNSGGITDSDRSGGSREDIGSIHGHQSVTFALPTGDCQNRKRTNPTFDVRHSKLSM
jgi:hypothetical protein